MEESGIKRRGFASMSTEERRTIASKGGKAAHVQGKAHEWTSTEASQAGKKGGQHSKRRVQGIEYVTSPGQQRENGQFFDGGG